jgi:hypothetical protein
MQFNFKEFLNPDFWFAVDRASLHLTDKVIGGIALGLIVLAIAFFVAQRRVASPFDRDILSKFSAATFWFGLCEALWFGMRYENAYFLGTRIVAALIAVVFLVWLGFITAKYLRQRKPALAAWQKEQIKLKYLPKQR